MAKIEVTGTVTKIFYGGKAAAIVEWFTGQNGEQMKRQFTAWFQEPVNFNEGAEGVFSGSLSAKIEKWVDKDGNPKMDNSGVQGQSVRVSINDASFMGVDGQVNQPAGNQDFDDMGWTPVAPPVDDTPF